MLTLSACGDDNSSDDESNTTENQTTSETNAIANEQEEIEHEVEEEKEEEEKIDLSNETDADIIAKQLQKIHDNVSKVTIEDGMAIIVYYDEFVWSETSLFEDFAIDSITIMKELKDNNNFKGIGFIQKHKMIDQKGNESVDTVIISYFDKENYDEINFENIPSMIYADFSNFYKISNGYWIHPAIYQNVKESTLNGLSFIPAETSKGFDKLVDLSENISE